MVCGDLSLMGLQRPVPCIAAVCVVFVFFFYQRVTFAWSEPEGNDREILA